MAHQMDLEVQQELRAMPGNNRCVDCQAPYPQWATVSYGTFMCLECSGRHRGLGVHISFVRSVTMDSWTDKQIRQMQLGGNEHFRTEFGNAGVPTTLSIQEKYNTPQATAFRERLSSLADGKPAVSLPKWDASMMPQKSTPGGDEKGMEALKGESEADYIARQTRLREEARERMRNKFGGSGMQGIGSAGSAPSSSGGGDFTETLGSAFSRLSTTVSSAASSATNVLREQQLGSAVSSGWSSVSSKLNEPDLKSSASSGWAALSGGASSLWKSAASLYSDTAQEEETSAFPRTNQDLANRSSTMGQGISSSEQVAPPPAAPVSSTSNDDEWMQQNLNKAKQNIPIDTAPRPVVAAKKTPPKSNKPKKEVDLFAEFGV